MTKPKSAPPPPRTPAKKPKPYVLQISFSPEDVRILQALEAAMRLRRTPLIRFLLAEEAKRRGL